MKEQSSKATPEPSEGSYTKDQFLSSTKYSYQDKDVLAALLDPDTLYTVAQVQQVVDDFKKKEVE